MIHSFSMENKGHDSQFFNENHRSGLRNIYSSNSESYNKSTVGPCTLLFSSKKKSNSESGVNAINYNGEQ